MSLFRIFQGHLKLPRNRHHDSGRLQGGGQKQCSPRASSAPESLAFHVTWVTRWRASHASSKLHVVYDNASRYDNLCEYVQVPCAPPSRTDPTSGLVRVWRAERTVWTRQTGSIPAGVHERKPLPRTYADLGFGDCTVLAYYKTTLGSFIPSAGSANCRGERHKAV